MAGAKLQAIGAASMLLLLTGLPLLSVGAGAAPLSGWMGAQIIEPYNHTSANDPDLASNSGGDTMAVWNMMEGNYSRIWSRSFSPSSGWALPVLVNPNGAGDAGRPSLAIDESGNVVAAWQELNGSVADIWANTYDPSAGWGTPEILDKAASGSAVRSQVSMDAYGHAFVVWREFDGTYYNIAANVWTMGSGWAGAQTIDGRNGLPLFPQVGAYGDGNAIAAWVQSDGTRDNVYYNKYTAGTGWAGDAAAEHNNSGSVQDLQLDVSAQGNAAIVWSFANGSDRLNVSAAYLVEGSGWSTDTSLGVGTADGGGPDVALDGEGNAIAVWSNRQAGQYSILARQYTKAGGWAASVSVANDSHYTDIYPYLDADGSLHAVVVWQRSDGARDTLVGAELSGTSGWGSASVLTPEFAIAPFVGPNVVLDGSGNALAYWTHSDGIVYNLWGDRLTQPDTTPPTVVLTSPVDGNVTNLPWTTVSGTAVGAQGVTVNGFAVALAANGSFGIVLGLFRPSNPIVVTSWDASGNAAIVWLNVTFVDPVAILLSDLDSRVFALQTQLNLLNSTLWQALAGTNGTIAATLAAQNASIAAALASQNSTLLAGLAAQNASLLGAISNLNASLLASLAAQNASLLQVIASTNASLAVQLGSLNASLLAQLAATNASLLSVIAAQNASLLASLAAQNTSLAQLIASTNASMTVQLASLNASLLAQLSATNASLLGVIAAQNASLLASLAAQNTSLAQLIAATNASMAAQLASLNASLLAKLAATNTSLLNLLASQNTSLLASLAAQDASLTQLIAQVNASLYASLASQNSALLASLAATNASLFSALAGQNLSLLEDLASLDAALAAQIVAGDTALAGELASLNQSLLAQLAALNGTLRGQLAATDSSLLASLAAQDAALRELIRLTNTSLLASLAVLSQDLLTQIAAGDRALVGQLAAQNATLWGKLTADNGALWSALNATNQGSGSPDPAIAASQAEAASARSAAASASTLGMLGLLAGIAGAALGLMGMRAGRKTANGSPLAAPPPTSAQPPSQEPGEQGQP